MTPPSNINHQMTGFVQPASRVRIGSHANHLTLTDDPMYHSLIDQFQMGEFTDCEELINTLEQKYPHHPELNKLQEEIRIKQAFRNFNSMNIKADKRKKKLTTFRLAAFAVFGTLVLMVAFVISYNNLFTNVADNRLETETTQMTSLSEQAEQLLLIGQPRPAAAIIEQMAAINPQYNGLPELAARTEQMVRLENEYNTALTLMEENKFDQALPILLAIENEKPGMWDVRQRIETVQN